MCPKIIIWTNMRPDLSYCTVEKPAVYWMHSPQLWWGSKILPFLFSSHGAQEPAITIREAFEIQTKKMWNFYLYGTLPPSTPKIVIMTIKFFFAFLDKLGRSKHEIKSVKFFFFYFEGFPKKKNDHNNVDGGHAEHEHNNTKVWYKEGV